jgi:hypothetical protein
MIESELSEVTERVEKESAFVTALFEEMARTVVGQRYMVERLVIGLLADGHVLLEGVPGLAKTLTVSTLARTIGTSFQRIQFTPDLLPADLLGTLIYNQKEGDFFIKKGPVFANIILADEVNRSPAKVQSALLECMQERQVTIGETTFLSTIPSSSCDAESDRTGRYVSAARGPGRPVHDEGQGRISDARGRTHDHAEDGKDGARSAEGGGDS